MEKFNRKKHWENIYQTKKLNEVSWYQQTPETSIYLTKLFNIPNEAKIIDIGGGDSYFVDYLLEMNYQNITVLDISENAINRAKQRLGKLANKITWIVADATTFNPTEKYDFWHDRAAFHFLTNKKEISNYLNTAYQNINKNGILIIGTFSENGPNKCSGIEIKQYSEQTMTELLKDFFIKIKCFTTDHKTPFNTIQNFVFCSFKKLIAN
jgi:ubiquinone/menaquinone biosynthesis C-methylase UbiE